MNRVWTLAKRELRSLFDHPTGYILLVILIGFNDFLFFRQAYLVGEASLRPMFQLLPWLMLFFVPAVTMRSFSEDLRSGTIELILAQPITEVELLAGKYLGQVLFVWIAIALTAAIPVGLSLGADLQVGVIFAQYVGAGLLGAGFVAVGVWTSSLTKNQITAFIVGIAVMFLLILIGLDLVLMGLPPVLSAVVVRLGVISHFASIERGVIDLRDVVYFVGLAGVFLVLAFQALMVRKLAPHSDALKRLRTGTALLVATVVVVNLLGRHIGGRLDLTPGNVYTLSNATRDILAGLDDRVTIKLFVSKDLPPEISLIKRDVNDLLADFRSAGDGKVRVIELDPADDPEIATEARTLGIPPVQFNVIGQSGFQVKEGYLGLAVQYADQTESIPLLRTSDDLEYRLATFVRSFTRQGRLVIGFVDQSAAPQALGQPPPPNFSTLRSQLSETYDVRTVNLETDSISPFEFNALVLAGSPAALTDSAAAKLEFYLHQGGSALVMASGMRVSTQMQQPFAVPSATPWNRILEPYGVSIQADMVYDLLSNEPVSLRTRLGNVLMEYPFWVQALSTKQVVLNQELESLFLPWTSSIDTAGAIPGTVTPLFVSSNGGGVETGQVFVAPQRRAFPQDSLGMQLLGVMVNPLAADDPPDSIPRGRLVVVGNGQFAGDQWVLNVAGNISFVLNSVDWLVQDEGLVAIRSKNRAQPRLIFESDFTRDLAKFGNLLGIPIVIVLVGGFRMWRRRAMTRKEYRPASVAEVA
ncbi:MAG: Gldg family protein [Gemmatimonadetes bacterium]|nr:Gldg family protein [Gemmatimonadota bacterium]